MQPVKAVVYFSFLCRQIESLCDFAQAAAIDIMVDAAAADVHCGVTLDETRDNRILTTLATAEHITHAVAAEEHIVLLLACSDSHVTDTDGTTTAVKVIK